MNTWINLTETENGLVITRPDNLDYLRKLENAVSSGIPVKTFSSFSSTL